MSSSVCRTCRNNGACTYPRNQIIVQCEEYEYADRRARNNEKDGEGRCEDKAQVGSLSAARLSAA